MDELDERFEYNTDTCLAEGSFGRVRLDETKRLLPACLQK